MRHVLLPRAIATSPLGMSKPAGTARLVAPRGRPLRALSGLSRAIPGTVDLAAIAAAADQRLGAAART